MSILAKPAEPITIDQATLDAIAAAADSVRDEDIAGEKRGPVLPPRRRRSKTRRDKSRARRRKRS